MDKVVSETSTREDLIEQVARLWAEGLAIQDARTAEQAARAGGASKPEYESAWIRHHRPSERPENEPTAV